MSADDVQARATEYREKAREMLIKAEPAGMEQSRSEYLAMARRWLEMARQVEQMAAIPDRLSGYLEKVAQRRLGT